MSADMERLRRLNSLLFVIEDLLTISRELLVDHVIPGYEEEYAQQTVEPGDLLRGKWSNSERTRVEPDERILEW